MQPTNLNPLDRTLNSKPSAPTTRCPHCMMVGFHSRCDSGLAGPPEQHQCEHCLSETRLCASGGTACEWAASNQGAGGKVSLCVICSGGATFTAEQRGAFEVEQVCSRPTCRRPPSHAFAPHISCVESASPPLFWCSLPPEIPALPTSSCPLCSYNPFAH